MRYITILLISLGSLMILAACGGSDPESPERTQITIAQTQVALSIGPTQTAQIAIVQTYEANPNLIITANADWTPAEHDFDGVTMVLVPAGCFMMGSKTCNEEQPVHKQCFDRPFWIDKYEVTQEQFRRLGGIQAYVPDFSDDNRPVSHITWFEARDFCALREARLPTEAEWEYAARGPDGLIYPWGDEFIANNVVYADNSGLQTANVGSRPGGASWVGALDMSGNVWEWTSSFELPYPYNATDGRESDTVSTLRNVLRGGAWGYTDIFYLRTSYRGWNQAHDWRNGNGFRCASAFN